MKRHDVRSMERRCRRFIAVLSSLIAACAAPCVAQGAVDAVSTGWNSAHDLSSWSDSTAWHTDQDYVVPKGKTVILGKSGVNDVTFPGGPLTIGDSSGAGTVVFYRSSIVRYPLGITFVNASVGCNVNIGSSSDYNTYTYHVYGDVNFVSTYKSAPQLSGSYRSNGQHVYFMGKLTGDANTGICYNSNENTNINTNDFLFFVGDLTGYYGYIEANNGGWPLCIGLGPSPCPGKVKLSGGANSLLRTATATNDATIAKLEMSANSALYPVIDMARLTNGAIRVTSQLTLTAPIHVCARFTGSVKGVTAPETWFPILSCPTGVGSLNLSDFDLVPMDAGEGGGDILSLRVQNDANGVPTLWLVKDAYVVDGNVTPYLSLSDGYQESAFEEAYAAHWTPSGVPIAGRRYEVKSGKLLRTPYFQPVVTTTAGVPGEDQTFGGDSITLGDATSRGEIQHWGYNKVIIPSLVISNGAYICSGNWSGNRHSWLDAPIEIAATSPANAEFRTGTTWQHLYLLGAVTGASGSACRMYFTNANSEMYPEGDWSGFHGTLEVTASASANVADVRFGSATTSLPGKLRLGATTASSSGSCKITAAGGLTVSDLEVNRPTTLYVSVNAFTLTSGGAFIVTNSFVQNADIAISLAASGEIINRTDNLAEAFIPILKVANSAGSVDVSRFSLSAFTGVSFTPPDLFELVARQEGGYTIVGLSKRRVVYLLTSDDNKTNSTLNAYSARTSFDRKWEASDGNNAGRADGWNWSINERPHPEYDYFSANNLRTHSSDATAIFRGHALFLKGYLTMQSSDITVTNLYLIGGTVQAIHEGGQSGVYPFLPSSALTRTLRGNMAVRVNSTVTSPSISSRRCALRLACDIRGPYQLSVTKNNSTANGMGYFELAGDNSGFTGVFKFSDNNASTDDDKCLVVLFTETKNLGGEMSAFTYNGIWLTRYATLRPMGSATLSRANRGVYVETVGGVEVVEGDAFTLDAPVTWRGALVKKGAGHLEFAQAPRFLGTDGKTVQNTPLANADSNVVRVAAGSIGVAAPGACDGLKLVMEDGASLRVKVESASAELAAQGLLNTKASTPFVLNGSDGKLHVSFDMSGVTDGKSHEVAICTLPTATAEALRANIVLERPMANYSAQLLPASSSGGATQTIFAKVCPRGFMMNIK